jgi:hypothetical protein
MKRARGFRRLRTPAGVFRYRVGRETLTLFSPSEQKHVFALLDVLGQDYADTLADKKRGDPEAKIAVTPSIVRAFVDRHFPS